MLDNYYGSYLGAESQKAFEDWFEPVDPAELADMAELGMPTATVSLEDQVEKQQMIDHIDHLIGADSPILFSAAESAIMQHAYSGQADDREHITVTVGLPIARVTHLRQKASSKIRARNVITGELSQLYYKS